jgi:hypothetical protein
VINISVKRNGMGAFETFRSCGFKRFREVIQKVVMEAYKKYWDKGR